ncbi:cobalt ABC transporter permease [Secundilactobacillus oryzae JCM 18671]|uniref:Energy-coupling factor transporter transmembrane protein EcfT n=1 Tax=Secundilactobacillus oryzae JCM 18671 TaxID=1291743 RepID=A0A081BK60_9LACO|nr:energy-coupling factor transporter transmembrane component T [Secundilactobacillus oryzae]GAK48428.1 cobalt ABC transporter permease [Secundilactobacillus oryzae JCM 18671]
MDKFIFGRYIPGDSWVHRMDPRSKMLLSFFFIFMIFFANNLLSYGLVFVVLFLAIMMARVSVGFLLKGLKPLLWLMVFTVLIQVFFGAGGEVYWSWWTLQITHDGLISAAFILLRFLAIIMMSTILTLTTKPLQIADGVESLLKPLKVIHFPVETLALMLSLALRFVPTLMDEAQKIMDAQRARGVDFGSGGIKQQVKTVVPLLIPLFMNAFNRAEDIATAMDARGYRDGKNRTKYRELIWQRRDTISSLIFVLSGIILFLIRN